MLRVKIILRAEKDLDSGYKKGNTCVLINDIFDLKTGIAFEEIAEGWEVIHMELLEYKPIIIQEL